MNTRLCTIFLSVIFSLSFSPTGRCDFGFKFTKTPDRVIERPSRSSAGEDTTTVSQDDQLYNQGNRLYREGRYAEAEALYRQALRLDPLNGKAHWNLATALGQQGMYEEGIMEIEQALKIITNKKELKDVCKWQDWMKANLAAERLNEAAKKANDAWERGNTAYKQGNSEDALRYLENAAAWGKLVGDDSSDRELHRQIAAIRDDQRAQHENAQKQEQSVVSIRRRVADVADSLEAAPADLDFVQSDLAVKPEAFANAVSTFLTDSSVVDSRNVPSGLSKSVEDAIPHTPAGDRVRKGFQAAMLNDWKVGLAWFQDALNHEPNNPDLKKLVDFAQSALNKPKETRPSPSVSAESAHWLQGVKEDPRYKEIQSRWQDTKDMTLSFRDKPGPAAIKQYEQEIQDFYAVWATKHGNAQNYLELRKSSAALANACDQIEADKQASLVAESARWEKEWSKALANPNNRSDLKPDAPDVIGPQARRAITEHLHQVQAIEEATQKRLFEAGHQILTLGNSSLKP